MLLEEKNNDFLKTEKFIESNKKNLVFSEDRNLVVIFFNVIPFCNSSREVVDFVLFNNRSELLENENQDMKKFLIELKEYDFEIFVSSIIFSFKGHEKKICSKKRYFDIWRMGKGCTNPY